jgi:hypothetical protein
VLLDAPSDDHLGRRTSDFGSDGVHGLILEEWRDTLGGVGRTERAVGRQHDACIDASMTMSGTAQLGGRRLDERAIETDKV